MVREISGQLTALSNFSMAVALVAFSVSVRVGLRQTFQWSYAQESLSSMRLSDLNTIRLNQLIGFVLVKSVS